MYAVCFKTEYSNSKESLIGKALATQPCAPRTVKEQNKEKSYILFYDKAKGNRKIIIFSSQKSITCIKLFPFHKI